GSGSTGVPRDLAALGRFARESGAFSFVDAAQALGVLGMDAPALGIDALASSGRKWLLGPPEVGILAVNPARLVELDVPAPGMFSRDGDRWRSGARRFEGGAVAAPLLAGLHASISWLLENDVERRALANARALVDLARAAIFSRWSRSARTARFRPATFAW